MTLNYIMVTTGRAHCIHNCIYIYIYIYIYISCTKGNSLNRLRCKPSYDVTFNLSDGKYMAYTKPGNIPLHVNRKSNHPPCIIENIPKSINKRLSEISIDQNSFNQAALLYQKAIDDSGYNHRLTFTPSLT